MIWARGDLNTKLVLDGSVLPSRAKGLESAKESDVRECVLQWSSNKTTFLTRLRFFVFYCFVSHSIH